MWIITTILFTLLGWSCRNRTSRLLCVVAFFATFCHLVPMELFGAKIAPRVTLNFWDQFFLFGFGIPVAAEFGRNGIRQLANGKASILALALLLWGFISLGYGIQCGNELHPAFEELRGFAYLALIVIAGASGITSERELVLVLRWWLIGGLFAGVLAIALQVLYPAALAVLPEVFHNPGSTGEGMESRLHFEISKASLLAIPLLVLHFTHNQHRVASLLGLLLAIGVIAIGLTRAHFVLLGLSLVLCVLLVSGRFRAKMLLVFGGVGFIVAFLVFANPGLFEEVAARLGIRTEVLMARLSSSLSSSDANLRGRFRETSAAISDIAQSPVMGYGLGAIRPSYYSARSMGLDYFSDWNKYYVHNSYLSVGLQIGGIGLALFLALTSQSVADVWRTRRMLLSAGEFDAQQWNEAKSNSFTRRWPQPGEGVYGGQSLLCFPFGLLSASSSLVAVWALTLALAAFWPDLLSSSSSTLTLGIWVAASDACGRLAMDRARRRGTPALALSRWSQPVA